MCAQFLEKEVPDEPFPNTNNPAGFEARVQDWFAQNQRKALRNLGILGATFMAISALTIWRIAPDSAVGFLKAMKAL